MDPDFAISTKKEDLIATALSQAPDQAITSGAHSVFALSAAALLSGLSIPLLLMPTLAFNALFSLFVEKLNGLQLVENSTIEAADLVADVSTAFNAISQLAGWSLLAIAALITLQTGLIPLTTEPNVLATKNSSSMKRIRTPTIIILTAYFASLAFSAYQLHFQSISALIGMLTLWGFGTILFGNERLAIDNKGGHAQVSSFPFASDAAEKKKVVAQESHEKVL